MLLGIVCLLLNLYIYVLIARIILSWIPSLPEPLVPLARGLRMLTDPVLTPVRGLLPPVRIGVAALDLSPILVFLALSLVITFLCR
jgi:YggT family protein